jgi:3-deoxy-D-manno-octulosonic-acid transferase
MAESNDNVGNNEVLTDIARKIGSTLGAVAASTEAVKEKLTALGGEVERSVSRLKTQAKPRVKKARAKLKKAKAGARRVVAKASRKVSKGAAKARRKGARVAKAVRRRAKR